MNPTVLNALAAAFLRGVPSGAAERRATPPSGPTGLQTSVGAQWLGQHTTTPERREWRALKRRKGARQARRELKAERRAAAEALR